MSLRELNSSLNRRGPAPWRLSDKLRIVKPLEGSLTLHHWQRLAVPHLGTALEERSGIAVRGSISGNRNSSGLVLDEVGYCEREEVEPHISMDSRLPLDDTRTLHTVTNSTILHPEDQKQFDTTGLVASSTSAGGPRMSSGFGALKGEQSYSRSASRAGALSVANDSRWSGSRQSLFFTDEDTGSLAGSAVNSIMSDISSIYVRKRGLGGGLGGLGSLGGGSGWADLGLARVLTERQISGRMTASTLSLVSKTLQMSLFGMHSITLIAH